MDPLLDEKILLTIGRILPEIFNSTLHIKVTREAYGPSKNEGLCYEKCSSIDMFGDFNGTYFMGLDGYTKINLMPYIARAFSLDSVENITASQIFQEFINLICGHISSELNSAGFELDISPPKILDNKLVHINLGEYRQYIIIYMVADSDKKKYLGRIYTVVALRKFESDGK